jgi:hypothetical protein
MHAHPLGAGDPSGSFDLMLAHGITGFRQMSGSVRMLKDRAAGTLMPAGAPRLLAMPGTVLTPFNAGSAAAAAATVREQHDLAGRRGGSAPPGPGRQAPAGWPGPG